MYSSLYNLVDAESGRAGRNNTRHTLKHFRKAAVEHSRWIQIGDTILILMLLNTRETLFNVNKQNGLLGNLLREIPDWNLHVNVTINKKQEVASHN